MIHLGDITAISGYAVPPVDAVIGGSPCQDLSVAGKRAGLAGARSGLFMEQIRIIKEMREADARRGRTGQFIRPRFMVWENVPGAFSSNKGNDFRAVLEETIRIAEPDAPDVPLPPKGRWPMADAWYGDGWSVAYRVLDAQFWGVPQRRRRIALVADFGGHAAPEILFVRKSVCGDTAPGGAAREETAGGAGGGADCESKCRTDYLTGWDNQEKRVFSTKGVAPTLSGSDGGGGRTVCGYIYDARGSGDAVAYSFCSLASNSMKSKNPHSGCRIVEISRTLDASVPDPSKNQGGIAILQRVAGIDCRNLRENQELSGTLQAKENGGQSLNYIDPVMASGQVRRLTPLECERLQGYPDGWTDIGPWTDSAGKLHKESSDSARYTALGNSIALPPWAWVLKRLCACYERPATMASLFDGIGGFPLIWERLNGPGSCLWASEIEEFPIAVTLRRFGGGNEDRID